MKLITLCLAASAALLLAADDDEPGKAMPAASPDGRWIVRRLSEEEITKSGVKVDDNFENLPGIFDATTGARLCNAPQEGLGGFYESVRVVWSKDSNRLALNFRAGGRYFATSLSTFDGKKVHELPSPEDVLTGVLTKEKAAQIKAIGLKPDVYTRRIHDSFTTRRWIDGNTVEIDAHSIRTVTVKAKGEDEIMDLEARFRCTLKFDAKSKQWKLLKAEKLKTE